MILEVDIGNSRAKWRTLDERGMVVSGGNWNHDGALPANADAFDAMLGHTTPRRIRIASVASDALSGTLQDWAKAREILLEFAITRKTCAGVRNSYTEPSRMGVDRWLAMLAAFNLYKGNVCVIDCGTAFTLDVVLANGQHEGGLIIPGMRLQQNALRQHTDKVSFAEHGDEGQLRLGTDTTGCVHNGSKFVLSGVVHEVLYHAKEKFGADLQCVLAGGDAAVLAPLLRAEVIENPDLVLDGLRYALP